MPAGWAGWLGGLPVIGVIDDLVWLGLKPAVRIGAWQAGSVPPYLPRSVDWRLDEAARNQPFVLVAGESAADKTRVAFESVRRCSRSGRMTWTPIWARTG